MALDLGVPSGRITNILTVVARSPRTRRYGCRHRPDQFGVLATLAETYEDTRWPIDPPDPVEAIKFAMDRRGYAFHVTANWRLTFKFRDGDAYDLDYEDYH